MNQIVEVSLPLGSNDDLLESGSYIGNEFNLDSLARVQSNLKYKSICEFLVISDSASFFLKTFDSKGIKKIYRYLLDFKTGKKLFSKIVDINREKEFDYSHYTYEKNGISLQFYNNGTSFNLNCLEEKNSEDNFLKISLSTGTISKENVATFDRLKTKKEGYWALETSYPLLDIEGYVQIKDTATYFNKDSFASFSSVNGIMPKRISFFSLKGASYVFNRLIGFNLKQNFFKNTLENTNILSVDKVKIEVGNICFDTSKCDLKNDIKNLRIYDDKSVIEWNFDQIDSVYLEKSLFNKERLVFGNVSGKIRLANQKPIEIDNFKACLFIKS